MTRHWLTARHNRIIFCLITEPSMEDAAAKAGVSKRTIYRLFKVPAFRQAFDEANNRYRGALADELARRGAPELIDAIANMIDRAKDRVDEARGEPVASGI